MVLLPKRNVTLVCKLSVSLSLSLTLFLILFDQLKQFRCVCSVVRLLPMQLIQFLLFLVPTQPLWIDIFKVFFSYLFAINGYVVYAMYAVQCTASVHRFCFLCFFIVVAFVVCQQNILITYKAHKLSLNYRQKRNVLFFSVYFVRLFCCIYGNILQKCYVGTCSR